LKVTEELTIRSSVQIVNKLSNFKKLMRQVFKNMRVINLSLTAVFIASLFVFWGSALPVMAAETEDQQDTSMPAVQDNSSDEESEDLWAEDDDFEDGETGESATLADPLEPVNRIFYQFNDKLYFWVLKPVAKGYRAILPEDIRIVTRNFFNNLLAPTSVVNNLLQGKVKKSSEELVRFVLNSTVGILGLGDFAQDVLKLDPTYEDTGQTLGYWGMGGMMYIHWPIFGPSNVRDTIGMVGDHFLHPINYVDIKWQERLAIKALDRVNRTSLTLGDYELFIETALDPYAAVKDAYHQNRIGKIEDK